MVWLEAAAAFCVVMIVLSSLITVIVETINKLTGAREKGLANLIIAIRKELEGYQYWAKQHEQTSYKLDEDEDTFLHRILSVNTTNIFAKVQGNWFSKCFARIRKTLRRGHLAHLSTDDFLRKLARTQLGQKLFSHSVTADNSTDQANKDKVDTEFKVVVNRIAERYEDLGQQISEDFKQRASLKSIVIAVVVALVMNINVFTIFDQLVHNTQLRSVWIDIGNQMPEPSDQQTSGDSTEVTLLSQQAAAQMQLLSDNGIPMGWIGFCETPTPNAINNENWCQQMKAKTNTKTEHKEYLLYYAYYISIGLIQLLISGVLIGLGGPFWFDAFKKLTKIIAMVRGVSPPEKPTQPDDVIKHKVASQQYNIDILKNALHAELIKSRQ